MRSSSRSSCRPHSDLAPRSTGNGSRCSTTREAINLIRYTLRDATTHTSSTPRYWFRPATSSCCAAMAIRPSTAASPATMTTLPSLSIHRRSDQSSRCRRQPRGCRRLHSLLVLARRLYGVRREPERGQQRAGELGGVDLARGRLRRRRDRRSQRHSRSATTARRGRTASTAISLARSASASRTTATRWRVGTGAIPLRGRTAPTACPARGCGGHPRGLHRYRHGASRPSAWSSSKRGSRSAPLRDRFRVRARRLTRRLALVDAQLNVERRDGGGRRLVSATGALNVGTDLSVLGASRRTTR